MRGRRQHPHELELLDSRRSQEVRTEACLPTRFQIRDAVLSMAHLNAGLIVEVVNQQDGQKTPVTSIADYPRHARVKVAGPSPIWIGRVELGIQYLNTRHCAVGNFRCRKNGLSLPVRPQITEPETASQKRNRGHKVSELSHPLAPILATLSCLQIASLYPRGQRGKQQ